MARCTLPAARPDVAEKVVTGGVDTHLDVQVVAALDRIGGLLGTAYGAGLTRAPVREGPRST